MLSFKPSPGTEVRKIRIKACGRSVPLLIAAPKKRRANTPGILWIHGGGYCLGMKEMVHASRAADLIEKYGAVVISPGYSLSFLRPYPAAPEECYAALVYLKDHAAELDVDSSRIMVGGESAGGGLCAAVCMLARDRGEVNVAFQMPLYPMLDNFETETSRCNHGKVWNTRRNRLGWKLYLRGDAKKSVSPYASPARQTDWSRLPPAYTFVGTGEPFYAETLTYIENLRSAGVEASVDVYPSDMHAFDMLRPELDISRQAAARFLEAFESALSRYTAENRSNT